MIKAIVTIGFVLALAFVGGGLTAHYATANFAGFGPFSVGVWTGHPAIGSPDADPYMRAATARTGRLALGSAEGLELIAERDSAGQMLNGQCQYRISGPVPANRFWTLRLVDTARAPLPPNSQRLNRTHSRQVQRDANGAIDIILSAEPAPGTWLHLDHDGRFLVLLTMYDTAIATGTGLSAITLPEISNLGCRS